MENKHSYEELAQYQSLPLDAKIMMTQQRIRAWYDYFKGQVYVSFSGGKDSTVLLDLVRDMYPEVPAVFVDTGLEFPEIKEFVKSKENVTILRPKMSFREVIEKYGYPVIGKEVAHVLDYAKRGNEWAIHYLNGENRDGTYSGFCRRHYSKYGYLIDAPFKVSERCCSVMKKVPLEKYYRDEKRFPFLGTMAGESELRLQKWLKSGCNAFDNKKPVSMPMSFWAEQDVLEYIASKKLPYAPVYGEIVERGGRYQCTGYTRTGCVFCAFGAHLRHPNQFQLLRQTHPKLFEYCMKPWDEGGLGMKEVLDYVGIEYSNGLLDLLEEERK